MKMVDSRSDELNLTLSRSAFYELFDMYLHIVIEVKVRHDRQNVLLNRQLAVDEFAFWEILLRFSKSRSSRGNKVPIQHVDLVLSSDDGQMSSEKGFLGL